MSSDSPDELDARDMERLAAGEDAALNSIIQRHGEKLFHYLIRQLRDDGDAADLAQETFVRVYQNRQKFDLRKSFSTWLYTIATNLIRNKFRWRQRHPEVSLEPNDDQAWREPVAAGPSPSESLQAEERAKEVRAAIQQLPLELRTCLLLSEYEGLAHLEIAAVMKCSAKAVESRLYRARQHLRAALEKNFAEK